MLNEIISIYIPLFPGISEICCKEVLNFVAEELEEDWYHFLQILSNNSRIAKEMQTDGKSGKENMTDYFDSQAFQVKWNDLKRSLLQIEKGSIVDKIEKNFLYTKGT